MSEENTRVKEVRPAGYEALIARYELDVFPNWHSSYVTNSGLRRIDTTPEITREIYSSRYWPGDTFGDHLEFALKYDGTNLAILASLFEQAPEQELLAYIESKPNGKYARQLWFLYEFLTGRNLPLDDVSQGNYVDLLDPKKYFTVSPARRVRRQRVNDNLLGVREFCPTVRRTETIHAFQAADLTDQCEKVVSAYSPELIRRALGYLYMKETKSSFEIEHIRPNSNRTDRFVAMLQLAENEDFCEKPRLIDLQNCIVDPRFRDDDYRESQNYVGESVAWQREKVYFVSPKPGDLESLMSGLVTAHSRMDESGVHPVVHAAAVAYGFVFVHPFEDGNGRIHRFLIHNILARQGFTAGGIMFPVSASMLKNPAEYDASLEAFSDPLMPLVEYSLDEEGHMTVQNDTARWYAYIDMTAQAEALFRFIEQTIEQELAGELSFLAAYDETKNAIREIVDMPNRKIDLFIRFCAQNNGQISVRKRDSHFDFLTDDEVIRMERAIASTYHPAPP